MGKFEKLFDKNGVFHSSSFLSVLAFLAVAIVITAILSSRYYLYQNIIENGVSKKQIILKLLTRKKQSLLNVKFQIKSDPL